MVVSQQLVPSAADHTVFDRALCVLACSSLELRTITVDLLPWGSIVDGSALNNTQLALGQGGELRLSVCDLPGPSPVVAGLRIDLLFRPEATGLSIAGHCAVTLPVLLPAQARGPCGVLTLTSALQRRRWANSNTASITLLSWGVVLYFDLITSV